MKLAYSIFYTSDIKRISNFYRDTMKFDSAFGNERFVAFKIGEALLGIKIAEHDREVPGYQTIIIEVKSIEKLYESCKSGEIQIYKELSTESWGKNFAILDPDGNKVEFTEK